jgi:D-alanyl-D-alanine carboxypeptidase
MPAWPHQSKVDEFYGDPRGVDGHENPEWVTQNIVRLAVPWKLITSWDSRPVSAMRVHKKCADSLDRVLKTIWKDANQSEQKIMEWGMHLYGGAFNFRRMTGATRLSMHSWGCAVDFDPARNAYGNHSPNFAAIPAVTDAFAAEGWTWGGKWSHPDGMHWQAANV